MKKQKWTIAATGLALALGLALSAACGAPGSRDAAKEVAGETVAAAKTAAGRTAGYNELRNPYFGQTHLHTGWSFDEAIYNVRLGPDNSYRHARGEKVKHPNGQWVQLKLALELKRTIWDEYVRIADSFYEPGTFTTLVGYEWSSQPNMSNLHRNVIFRSSENLPVPFSYFDSQRPEDLWKWMDEQRARGLTLFAIPHNGNLSNGGMFALEDSSGQPITRPYAETRMRNETAVTAFYYLRVLEIPTPRWSTFDAKALGIDPPKDFPATIQERAWTSPIWYTP